MELKLPPELEAMIREGLWPSASQGTKAHIIGPDPLEEQVEGLPPDEIKLYLLPPPFRTVHQQMTGPDRSFWEHPMAAVHEIDPELALVIGDFGLGSDVPIILDYRSDKTNPCVMNLEWKIVPDKSPFCDNHWMKLSDTFADFALVLRSGTH